MNLFWQLSVIAWPAWKFISAAADPPDPYPHPPLAAPASWPGVMVIIIVLGFFVLAMLVGPIVRATMRESKAEEESRLGE